MKKLFPLISRHLVCCIIAVLCISFAYAAENDNAPYQIGKIRLYDMVTNEELTEIPQGECWVSVPVTNHSYFQESPMVAVCTYNEYGQYNNVLLRAGFSDLPRNATVTLQMPLDNTDGRSKTLKAFVLQSLTDFTPLGKAVTFGEEEEEENPPHEDMQMFVPVGFFVIDTDEDNAHGTAAAPYDRYQFFFQGVDANGDEVKIYVDVADLLDETGNLNPATDMFTNLLDLDIFDLTDFMPFTREDKLNEIATALATMNGTPMDPVPAELDSGVAGSLYFYKDTSIEIGTETKDYTMFSRYEYTSDEDDAVTYYNTFYGDGVVTKDTKRLFCSDGNVYLLGAGYTVISYSGNGSQLEISTAENAYNKLNNTGGAILYGTRSENAKTGDPYTLKYVFVESSSTSVDDPIFVPERFTRDNPVNVTYPQNGRDKTETFYEETIYDGAEKKTIYVPERVANIGVGFYEYTYDDVSGAYTAFTNSASDTMGVFGMKFENGGMTFNTLAGTKIYDKDLSNALIVNTTDYDIKTNSFGSDTKHEYFACVKFDEDIYDWSGFLDRTAADRAEVESVYIYAVAPRITLTNSAGKDAKVTYEYDACADQWFITYTFDAGTDLSAIRVNMSSAQGIPGVKNGVNDLSSIASWFMIYEDNCERIPARIVVECAS